jgi:pimeloyl-ACP methyl ester carboxylesterase/DNA-binding CsgD family transcriptional regulator
MALPPVQYVRTSDGYDIAYRAVGSGPPLVFIPPPLIDIDLVWQWFPGWMEGLAARFRLIQFDCRGQGSSTRNLPAAVTMDAFYRDLEAIMTRVDGERVFIWGWAMPAHLAVRYAVNHPGRVSGLILNTCSVAGTWKPVQFGMLPHENWDLFLTTIAPPRLSPEETRLKVQEFKACMSRQDWEAWHGAASASDVTAELAEVRAPALVMHPRRFRSVSAEDSVRFAAMIPDARFQLIDGDYIYGDAEPGMAAIDAFLATLDLSHAVSPNDMPVRPNGLSSRELEVLRLLAAGKGNQQIADELVISLNTARKHVSNILDKTGTANRTEAAGYARDHGLA